MLMDEDDEINAAPFVARAHLRRNFSFSHPGRPRRAGLESIEDGLARLDLPPTPRPRLRGQGRPASYSHWLTPRQRRRRSLGLEGLEAGPPPWDELDPGPAEGVHTEAEDGPRASWNGRIAGLCHASRLSDVTFVVEAVEADEAPIRFRAHRLLLALRSPVFEAMFFGSLVESGREIEVPDVTPSAFQAMLVYIYTEKVTCQDLVNVWHLWYAARKYMLEGLEDICRRHLKLRLNPKNVLDTYLYAENFGDTQMLYECLKLIDRNAQSILSSSKCSTLPMEILQGIVKRNTLNAKEVEIFESVIRWSQAEIKRRLEDDDEGEVPSLSDLFKEFQPLLRFSGFTSQEFVHTVLPFGVLDIEAISHIASTIRHKEEPETFQESENPLSSPEPRTGLNQARDLFFESEEANSNSLRNGKIHIHQPDDAKEQKRLGPGYYQCARFSPEESVGVVTKWPDTFVLKFKADQNIYLIGACITETHQRFFKPNFNFILKLRDIGTGRVLSEGAETFTKKSSNQKLDGGLPAKGLYPNPHNVSLRSVAHIYKDKWYELCLTLSRLDRDLRNAPMLMTQCKEKADAFGVNFEFKSRTMPEEEASVDDIGIEKTSSKAENDDEEEEDQDGFFDKNLVPGFFSRLYFYY
eukprot:maker-scaffold116_size340332-snap-gene-2.23 protein:Tk07660 transcript:maker-scaffold116_size340332-snap-gene-2.23-mRNA-1 annotation:"btb poz domain containing 6"